MKKITGLLVAVLLAVPATSAADTTFRFRGGGWGHGVGMSQHGAYGLAAKGWTRDQILGWYYRGTSLARKDPPKPRIRVGLLQRRDTFTLTAQGGSFDFVLSKATGDVIDTVGAGTSRTVVISGGRYKIYAGKDLLGTFGGTDNHLYALRGGDGRIAVSGLGYRLNRGRLQFDIVSSTHAHLNVRLGLERYLYGLNEVPFSWPAAVLESQANAARTYTYRIVAGGSRVSSCSCDIFSDTRDQRYMGYDAETGLLGDRWVQAVVDTAKEIVTRNGNPVITVYSSSSGGWIEAADKVWGGSVQTHLRARCDPGDFISANPHRTWTVEMTGREAASNLRSRFGWNIRRVTRFSVLERGASGRILRARVRGKNANGDSVSFSASGESIRRGLALKSTRFWINQNRQVTGAIRREYDNLRCRPGLPRSSRRSTNDGLWQRFAKGRIYSKNGPGTHWLHGLVLRRYLDAKGPAGVLRYPTTHVTRLSDGRLRTRFQGGVIICKPSTRRCSLKRT